MNAIPVRAHRVLDYVTVVIFAAAPTALSLTGLPAQIAYVLAGVHLAMTLLTHFPGGAARPIPMSLHAVVEALVGPVLIVLPFALGWTGMARNFYIGIGVVILLVWLGTAYRTGSESGPAL